MTLKHRAAIEEEDAAALKLGSGKTPENDLQYF
jgi:hypothetical protein